ncbi:hypothetical protein C8J56DRAFT_565079 [Mycena floridula]|nr:hypothetical protein C8J56DRAFT_565079 [Mycena floridula]
MASAVFQHLDDPSKRAFLTERGLKEPEIDALLRGTPPIIPPRTYPQPPPSHLPNLLLGIARIASWLAGGSLLVMFIYRRLLLPRITHTSLAREALQKHHLALIQRLAASTASFKKSRAESLSNLPVPHDEPASFAKCSSLEEVIQESDSQKLQLVDIPPQTLLRCAITDLVKEKDGGPTTDELFELLENKIPWLTSVEEGNAYEHKLWEALSTRPVFLSDSDDTQVVSRSSSARWSYVPPQSPSPPPLVTALASLLVFSSRKQSSQKFSLYQHTLQSLVDLTGYISSHIYIPYRQSGIGASGTTAGNIEDDLKKEIRALKGLVLNRRSFIPPVQRPTLVP